MKLKEIKTPYRTIKSQIPHPEDILVRDIISKREGSLVEKELPVVWDRAIDCNIFDRWGNQFIDLTSSIFVSNAGHGNKKVAEAIVETASRGLLHSYLYPTVERAKLLELLVQISPENLTAASLLTGGSEASERAIKLARIRCKNLREGSALIIGGERNYHGKTLGALLTANTNVSKAWVGYYDVGMCTLSFPYPWVCSELEGAARFSGDIRQLLEQKQSSPKDIAAFIVESYQGWGAIFYPKSYIKAMREFCDLHDILLIFDEIQAGFWRTGELFAYQHYGVEADMVVLGKGISGSLPLSAVLTTRDIIELDPSLTSTHGGHPLCCAAAIANINELLSDEVQQNAKYVSAMMASVLKGWGEKYPSKISRVCCKGMVAAVFLTNEAGELSPQFSDFVVREALQRGVFSIRTGCGTLKFGPPLTISWPMLSEALGVMESLIAAYVPTSEE